MNWKAVKVPVGGKIFKAHHFTYMNKGATYDIEVDEFLDGNCTGHGEHSADKNLVIESVSGKTVEECLSLLLERVSVRNG